MLKLNSLNQDIFNCNAAEFDGAERERAHIVTMGRALMVEYEGRAQNRMLAMQSKPSEYAVKFNDATETSYESINRGVREKMLMFAAKMACKQDGVNPPATFADFLRDSRTYFRNSTFMRVLGGLVRDIVRPVLPTVISDTLSWIVDPYSTPMGKTYELEINSNDVFRFEDDSWGASHSKPANYLYDTNVTLNPQLKTAHATAKWYQMVSNNVDMGRFFASISAGMYSKVMGMAMGAFNSAIQNTKYIPSALKFTNETKNWTTAASKLAMVNGTSFRNIVGIGHPSALAKALPNGNAASASATNLDAALATMLGVEYTRYGYLGEYAGVNLYPLQDAIVPGTQNTTIEGVLPTDKILLLSSGGYRPFALCTEEGTPITVEMTPKDSADMSVDIEVGIALDVQPVFASKVALISTAE